MEYDSIETSRFLIEFNPLIHKTLQRLQIRKTHMDYEDYFQELQIHLLRIRKKYKASEEITDQEIERYKFTAYASKGLYWQGLNLIKKNEKAVFNPIEDDNFEWLAFKQPADHLQTKSEFYIEDFFLQAKKRLTSEEYLLLLYLTEGEFTVAEIADMMGVTRSTIYNRKEKIQERLEGIKDCLKD